MTTRQVTLIGQVKIKTVELIAWVLAVHLISIRVPLTLQKSRMLQIQGVKGEAVVSYRKPLTTQVEDPASTGRCGILGFPKG